MRGLRAIGLGFNCDEDYVKGLVDQGRVVRRQGRVEQDIVNLAMERKIKDQRDSLRDLKDQQGGIRGELAVSFGKGTMAYRRSLRKLKRVGRTMESFHGPRLSQKIDHLKLKHKKPLQERGTPEVMEYKPKWKSKYPGVSVYTELDDPDEFEALLQEIDRERDADEAKAMVIGEVAVSSGERSVLGLHPSTGVLRKPDA